MSSKDSDKYNGSWIDSLYGIQVENLNDETMECYLAHLLSEIEVPSLTLGDRNISATQRFFASTYN